MIGVEYEKFWEFNPKTLTPFIKAFSLKQQYDDSMAWRVGQYNRMAVASVFNKSITYPRKPFLHDMTRINDATERQKIIKERFLAHASIITTVKQKGGS